MITVKSFRKKGKGKGASYIQYISDFSYPSIQSRFKSNSTLLPSICPIPSRFVESILVFFKGPRYQDSAVSCMTCMSLLPRSNLWAQPCISYFHAVTLTVLNRNGNPFRKSQVKHFCELTFSNKKISMSGYGFLGVQHRTHTTPSIYVLSQRHLFFFWHAAFSYFFMKTGTRGTKQSPKRGIIKKG